MCKGLVMAELRTDLNEQTGLFGSSSFLLVLRTVSVALRSWSRRAACTTTGMLAPTSVQKAFFAGVRIAFVSCAETPPPPKNPSSYCSKIPHPLLFCKPGTLISTLRVPAFPPSTAERSESVNQRLPLLQSADLLKQMGGFRWTQCHYSCTITSAFKQNRNNSA